MAQPSTHEILQRFIATRDPSLLARPLLMEKSPRFADYLCCWNCWFHTCTCGLTACVLPLTLCPSSTLVDDFSMQMDRNSVTVNSAQNDCCCHVAKNKLSAPWEKIQDVGLSENWMLSMFGLKQVSIDTAGFSSIPSPYSSLPTFAIAFLAYPETVREAIQLAVRLNKESMGMAPPDVTMQRGAGAAGPPGGLTLRLNNLAGLVHRGLLSPQEADWLRAAVLTNQEDPLVRLMEAAHLVENRLITPQEVGVIKASVFAQVHDGYRKAAPPQAPPAAEKPT